MDIANMMEKMKIQVLFYIQKNWMKIFCPMGD